MPADGMEGGIFLMRLPSDVAEIADANESVRKIELVISTILRVGVTLSLLVIVTGTVISFVRHPGYVDSPKALLALTRPGQAMPRTLGEIFAGVAEGRGQAIVMAGLLLLLATPVIRVAVAILAFLAQKDRRFAVITTVVLCLLLLSFFLGRAE
jgi:uncharacterized membrane protein